ncbi:diguanylate cyclase (GGDEF)-like protein [Rhodanobacter sp. A1T4]|nr:diguanylate cyclase (GGDEF)-like protein [Rhodanobacter sp. A1T4]
MERWITLTASGRYQRLWAGFVLCLVWMGSVHASAQLNGAWRPALSTDTPQTVMQEYLDGQLKGFDPSILQRFQVSALGSWVVIVPKPPWDNNERVLTIYPPPFDTVTVYEQDQTTALALDDFKVSAHGHGRLAWRVPLSQAASVPILLKFEPSVTLSAPVRFEIQPWNEYLQQDAQWLVFASACFAIMLAMVLMALCFALMLRDITFAWYAGFILCYTFIQGVQTGFLFHPLEWEWLSGMGMTSGSIAVALSVAFASLFMMRFCELRTRAPLLRVPVIALAVGMSLLVMMRCSQIALLTDTAQILLNPLLMIGAVLLLLSAIAAGIRGSRQAWFFLLGWTPLLLLNAMTSAQANGALPSLDWLNDASLAGGAFEAIVLSLGLADRALRLRQDRDLVRVLADHDALTNTLNRRAWSERANIILSSGEPRPVALLFLDLDHFKLLNDCQGHNAGDRALVAVSRALSAELRPTDIFGRYGGEEFVALIDGTTEEHAMHVATRLCRRVHRLEIPVNENVMLSISIGVAMRRDDDDVESLAERADQAMYTAKLGGRNQVSLYSGIKSSATSTSSGLHVVEKRRRDI